MEKVTIVDYKPRINSQNEEFFSLILSGGLELVKSKETGNFYATSSTTSITSTFSEEVCKSLIGQEIPGSIQKVSCEEYEYTIKETGEVVMLSHQYVFIPDGEFFNEEVH